MKPILRVAIIFSATVILPIVIGFVSFSAYEAIDLYRQDADTRYTTLLNDYKSPFSDDSPARKAYAGEILPSEETFYFDPIGPGLYKNTPRVQYIYKTPAQATHVTIDPHGFRVSAPREKLESIDILTLGESNTWGHGVKARETFAEIYSSHYGLTHGNASIPGYSAIQALLGLKLYDGPKPSYVLFGFFEDMIYRNIQQAGQRPLLGIDIDTGEFYVRPAGTTIYDQIYIPWMKVFGLQKINFDQKYVAYLNAIFFRMKFNYYNAMYKLFNLHEVKFSWYFFNAGLRPAHKDPLMTPILERGMTLLLNKLHQEVHNMGSELIVFFFPYVPPQPWEPVPNIWTTMAETNGFTFVNANPIFENKSGDPNKNAELLTKFIISDDGHFNATAHAEFGSLLIEHAKIDPDKNLVK